MTLSRAVPSPRRRSSTRPATAPPRRSRDRRRSEWTEPGEEADYELVDISLDQLEAAAGAGQYSAAEQARLAAYGFFEFGPELKLRAFDPQLALKIEGLIWYGADGRAGLASLVADKAPLPEIRETRLDLDEELADARALTGDGASTTTVDRQLGADRLPRGPRGDPDPGRDHRQHDRPAGAAAQPDLPRRAACPAGERA